MSLPTLDGQPWLMEPSRLEAMARRLAAADHWPTPAQIDAYRESSRAGAARAQGAVAVLQIHGPVEQRASFLGCLFGGFSTEDGSAALARLAADDAVSAVVLDIDSPGGTVSGVEEFAEEVYALRKVKPVCAVANSLAASAAYWIAAAAGEVAVTPSGEVGSVGVYCLHTDYSGALEKEGVKVTIARTPKWKGEFQPFAPLAEESRQYMQESVELIYEKFVAALAKYRGVSAGTVKTRFGEGRTVPAAAAVARGMADRVATLQEVVGGLLSGKGRAPARSRMEVARLRHAHRIRAEAGEKGLTAG